jgi:hypothetical protein
MNKTIIHLQSFSDSFKDDPTDFYYKAIVDGKKFTIIKYLGGYDVFGKGFPFEAIEESILVEGGI